MTHEQLQDREIVEQYVRHKLSPADRQAFQEHYFNCDDCFEQVQLMARFVAGVREASARGVLAEDRREHSNLVSPAFYPSWFRSWAIPALAASFLLASVLLGVWALSMRRENQRLAQQAGEQRRADEQLRKLEAKVRELEAGSTTSQAEKESLKQEIDRLKEQVATAERSRETRVAQVRPRDVNVPAINIYPLGDAQRAPGAGEVNRLNLPSRAVKFVLLLSDFQHGSAPYRVEMSDSSGRVVARRAGLRPDRNGELRVTLDRSRLSQDKYTVKLFGQGKVIAEYLVAIE